MIFTSKCKMLSVQQKIVTALKFGTGVILTNIGLTLIDGFPAKYIPNSWIRKGQTFKK